MMLGPAHRPQMKLSPGVCALQISQHCIPAMAMLPLPQILQGTVLGNWVHFEPVQNAVLLKALVTIIALCRVFRSEELLVPSGQ